MVGQLREAWELYKKRFLSWLAIGIVAGAIEMGLSGALTFQLRFSTSRYELFFLYTVGIITQALAFFIAGGIVTAAIHQSRTGHLDFRKLLVPGAAAPTLVVLSFVSYLTYQAVRWLADSVAQISYGWDYLIWFLAGPPFVLTIPLVVDRLLGPFAATNQSVRVTMPKYFGILAAQFLVWMYSIIAVVPFFCVMQIWAQRGQSEYWEFLGPGILFYALALPLYYLTVSQIYFALVPDPITVPGESGDTKQSYPSPRPPG